MRKIAIIENGLVSNTAVIPNGKAGDNEIKIRKAVEISGTQVAIGWGYDGTSFIEPDPTPEQLEQISKHSDNEAKKLSGRNKLLALGLTEAEVTALVG